MDCTIQINNPVPNRSQEESETIENIHRLFAVRDDGIHVRRFNLSSHGFIRGPFFAKRASKKQRSAPGYDNWTKLLLE
jgi:hypothetical protein